MAGRRFQATEQTTHRDLQSTMRKVKATGLKVNTSTDFETGLGKSEIIFDRGGRRYVVRCEKYRHALDNLRASQLAIDYLYRAMEEYGVLTTEEQLSDTFARFFLPFEATPDDEVLLLGSGQTDWWQVLGVEQNATKQEIINAYRSLARLHHPDAGGNADDFKRIRRAYEQGIQNA